VCYEGKCGGWMVGGVGRRVVGKDGLGGSALDGTGSELNRAAVWEWEGEYV
jgi:hypothetical protein